MSEGNELIEIANRISAELDAVAALASPPSKRYLRNYLEGAAIVSRIRGAPYGPESLRKSDILRIYAGREARLADEDLIALGEKLRAADLMTLHRGPPRRRAGRSDPDVVSKREAGAHVAAESPTS
jgi:hypothetical protein